MNPPLEEAGSWIYEIGVGCKRRERQQLGAAVAERHTTKIKGHTTDRDEGHRSDPPGLVRICQKLEVVSWWMMSHEICVYMERYSYDVI